MVSPRRARRRGFTLVELMVVMAIVALLLAIALPRYFGHLEKARETVLRQDLATMRDAIDKYHGDRGRYPDSLQELAAARYLRAVPVDPLTERNDTWQLVVPADGEAGAVYDVKSGAPGAARDGTAYADW